MTAIICKYFLVTPVLVAAKRLIISKMLKILGSFWVHRIISVEKRSFISV